MDRIDKYVYEQIQNRKETKELYENLFNRLYGIELSSTEARKELRGIENHLEYKKENEDVIDDTESIPKYNESTELLSDGSYKSDKLLKMNSEQSKDVEYLLKAHGFDSGFWQITSAKNNIWNVYSKQDGVQQLYSSKITVKPIVPDFKDEWIENVINTIDTSKFKIKEVNTYNLDGVTVEINMADVHIGKFVSELVSNGVYDADIAVDRARQSLFRAISKVSHYKIKKIIFVGGQDFVNIDTLEGTTTKLTRQDMNEFYETIYEKALSLMIECVEILRDIAPVDFIYVKGNHDKLTTFTMFKALEKLYKDVEGVNIDASMKQRKYRIIGNSLVGYSHGEEEKKRIFNCMQVDEMENWNKKYKYFHLSHLHSESKKEIGGVIYQWLGSLSENCKWTYGCGFVGAEKKCHVFVYDDVYGKESEFFIKA